MGGSRTATKQEAFEKHLAIGKVAEGQIARWLMKTRGVGILPVYEIEKATGKGPQFFVSDGGLVAPDMLTFGKKIAWVEAKHKTVFSWHRITKQWQTGIDQHHYRDYLKVAEITKLPLWILFFHVQEKPWESDLRMGCPSECPVGLFGRDIAVLKEKVNHEHPNHGRHGMVYWSHHALRLLATREEVFAAQ